MIICISSSVADFHDWSLTSQNNFTFSITVQLLDSCNWNRIIIFIESEVKFQLPGLQEEFTNMTQVHSKAM